MIQETQIMIHELVPCEPLDERQVAYDTLPECGRADCSNKATGAPYGRCDGCYEAALDWGMGA